jgi:hypothetical protein
MLQRLLQFVTVCNSNVTVGRYLPGAVTNLKPLPVAALSSVLFLFVTVVTVKIQVSWIHLMIPGRLFSPIFL